MRCLLVCVLAFLSCLGTANAVQKGFARITAAVKNYKVQTRDGKEEKKDELSLPFFYMKWEGQKTYQMDLSLRLVIRQFAKLSQTEDMIDPFVNEQLKLTNLTKYSLGLRNGIPYESVNDKEGGEGRGILEEFYNNPAMKPYLIAFSLLHRVMLPVGMLGNVVNQGVNREDMPAWEYDYETKEHVYRLAVRNDRHGRYTPTAMGKVFTDWRAKLSDEEKQTTFAVTFMADPVRMLEMRVHNLEEKAEHRGKVMRVEYYHQGVTKGDTADMRKAKRILSIDFGRQQ